jgi:hypothetical protein
MVMYLIEFAATNAHPHPGLIFTHPCVHNLILGEIRFPGGIISYPYSHVFSQADSVVAFRPLFNIAPLLVRSISSHALKGHPSLELCLELFPLSLAGIYIAVNSGCPFLETSLKTIFDISNPKRKITGLSF